MVAGAIASKKHAPIIYNTNGNSGSVAASSTSIQTAFGTSLLAPTTVGDIMLMPIFLASTSDTVATPTNWTKLYGPVDTAGGGTEMRAYLFWRTYALADYAYVDSNGLNLPGKFGNYASSPDSSALSITGDIDIRVRVKMTDWTPATSNGLVGKWTTTSNQRSYEFFVITNGKLQLDISSLGSDTVTAQSTVATGGTDGTQYWVRVTRASASGDVKFYFDADGAEPSSWTQLGTTVSTAASGIFDSTAQFDVGAIGASGNGSPATGIIAQVKILNGIDGTVAYNADFTARSGSWSFSESSSNAATVTINRAAVVTKTGTNGTSRGAIQLVKMATGIDTSASNSLNGAADATPVMPSVTTTALFTTIIGIVCNSGAAVTPATHWVETSDSNQIELSRMTPVQGGTTTGTFNFTNASNQKWVTFAVAVK